MQNPVWKKWYDERPAMVQQLVKQYPFDTYRIKEGAPYGIACAGTTVHLESYTERGDVGVIVLHTDLLPEAIEHIRDLTTIHAKNFDRMVRNDYMVHIDPQWMEEITQP